MAEKKPLIGKGVFFLPKIENDKQKEKTFEMSEGQEEVR